MGRSFAALAFAVVAFAGCGGTSATPLASECTAGAKGILAALEKAPGSALLPDGTPLSQCVLDGQDDGELQEVGIAFTQAAEQLRDPAESDPAQALRLGYLAGVARRGAARTNGVMLELVRRIEVVAGRTQDSATPECAAAIERGLKAGEANG